MRRRAVFCVEIWGIGDRVKKVMLFMVLLIIGLLITTCNGIILIGYFQKHIGIAAYVSSVLLVQSTAKMTAIQGDEKRFHTSAVGTVIHFSIVCFCQIFPYMVTVSIALWDNGSNVFGGLFQSVL